MANKERHSRLSLHASSSGPSHSRLLQSTLQPSGFLNMLNPMRGRAYQGYLRADQLVLEEDEDEDGEPRSNEGAGQHSKGNNNRRTSSGWGEASQMTVLRGHNMGNTPGDPDSSDDEVPQSFMIEPIQAKISPRFIKKGKEVAKHDSSNRPALSVPNEDGLNLPPRPSEIDPPEDIEAQNEPSRKQIRGLDAYEQALWNWVNVYDLDVYLQDVYRYYEGKGIISIALARGLHLLTIGFVMFFSTFLLNCIDYSRIKPEGITRLSDVVVNHCVSKFSGGTILLFTCFGAYYVVQIITYVYEVMRLVDMYKFYTYLLLIPDADIQTISWPEIVRRIEAIRNENPVTALSSTMQGNPSSSMTAKLDAHDIANRIMREENYLIALFNKDLLDLRIPLPKYLSSFFNQEEKHGLTLSTALEHNLRICLIRYLFDARGRVKEVFLKEKNRASLIEGLRYRFIFMGILNAVLAPFIVLYLLMYYFFRYFEEYHKNPSSIGSRRYTLYARWKFREFNELPHVFSRRMNESYPTASMYIGQFPNDKMALIMRFVSFVTGSFAGVLALASVIDTELFTHFEITPHRTVLFYITIFGSIMAAARGMVPEENSIFDPESLITEVIQYTHYMPDEWKGQLHSQKVHKEFGKLFDMKIMVFARELLSVIVTPFVLCFTLPNSAPAIIDFFREFTIHVDGLGYVCSFAVFDFKRHGNVQFGAPSKVKDERYLSKEGKMEKSFLNFKAANPEWQPTDPTSSLYLSRMAEYTHGHPGGRHFMQNSPSRRIADRERRLADRAQEYDRALKESQSAARRRRTTNIRITPASNDSSSRANAPSHSHAASTSQIDSSASHKASEEDSTNPFSATEEQRLSHVHASSDVFTENPVADELTRNGEVHSELGESYADARVMRGRPNTMMPSVRHEEEDVEDGGMLGLLAQIYGTRAPKML